MILKIIIIAINKFFLEMKINKVHASRSAYA